jgi:predicted MFS family arabinose efflux permease
MTGRPEAATQSRLYVLLILTLVYAFNHIDRQVLVILLEPIRQDLKLEDWHLGLLSGIGFAAVYATVGIPVAIWADRGVRRDIVALSLGVWSFMTVLSGFAQSFWHLLVARMGVGLGEAGGTPPATSMIADLYPPAQRATALGVYTLGIGLGILAGFPLGGLVYEAFGWRAAFLVAGAPGLLLAIVFRLTVKEPRRGGSDRIEAEAARPSVLSTFSFMLSQPSFLWLLAGCMLICVSANAFLAWTSPLLIRTYGVSVGEVSLALGLLVGGLGGLGAVLIGMLCDRLSKRDLRWRPWTILICAIIALPFAWAFLHAPSIEFAYLMNAVPAFVGLIYASIAYTAAQELVGIRMRATASAFTLFCLTLLGIGGGPTLVGFLSTHFASEDSGTSLRRALELMLVFNALSIVCLFLSSLTYRRDAERAAVGGSPMGKGFYKGGVQPQKEREQEAVR